MLRLHLPHTRRSITLSVVGAVVGVACIVGGVLAWPSGSDPAPSRPRASAGRTSTVSVPPGIAPPLCRSPLTADAPLRLWIAGDSLAYSIGNELGRSAAATGVIAPVYESRTSSGLANAGFFDWPKRMASELTRLDPEVVVLSLGTNDWPAPGAATTSGSTGGTTTTAPGWEARYAPLVRTVTQEATESGRLLIWVGPPPLRDTILDAGSREVARVVERVVDETPNALFVDGRKLLGDADGAFTSTIEVGGRKVVVRTGDGVHLTPEGGDVVGDKVLALIDARCRVQAQSVPNSRQVVVETKGSTAPTGTGTASGVTPTTAAPSATTTPTTTPTGTTTPPVSTTPTTAATTPTTTTTTAPGG